jgi:4-amino-4-deoxychorismate lyase
MCPLIETMRVENGKVNNLLYHQLRMQKALTEIAGSSQVVELERMLSKLPVPEHGLYKCRVIYTDKKAEMEITPYVFRAVKTLRLLHDDTIEYNHKFQDRSRIDHLFEQRTGCDDILIIKNGLVTDTSYANIIFKRENDWITPISFLLPGTQRQYLLDRKIIREENIREKDLRTFTSLKLINSMMLMDGPEILVENVKY